MNDKDLYGSGLNSTDWFALREAIGYASAGNLGKAKIPPHLADHPAAHALQEFLDGKKRALGKAVQAMVPGSSRAWLILMKT